MAETAMIKTQITREKCRAAALQKEGDDRVVLHPHSSNVLSDLAGRYPPTLQ